ncbi:DUF5000 domain-containing lipoprotein [Mucilaginibacter terrae]|uniref:DUF4959 domain-containing protein n=1 Tax=Mucilaginibacter terrae TaxID=1955052 RepID=A0ABU3H388_9SPHI|nr:DUF5000 domain-containing lipoprotein [Mucilaginibacter terrae]MDT3405380.1 hypothetical protein [Mucilaginibacter terrae]
MKAVKNKILRLGVYLLVLAMISLAACKKMEGYNTGPVSTDTTKPGTVSNVKVTNFNGGAYITYNLPNSSNILYVQGQYKINDKTTRQTKSSYYTDTILVDGFAQSKDYDVTLNVVSRANVMSDPVVVKVHPDVPIYKLVKPTVKIVADFGGVTITALNPKKKEMGYILLALDNSTNALEVQDQHYSNSDTVQYSVRGYEAKSRRFGLYVTDKFGNISDTTLITLTPLFEALLDKSKFSSYRTNSDSPIAYGWDVPYLWDGKTDGYSNGWHTAPGVPGPMQVTFGLGVSAQLSRFILWERPLEYTYAHGNPRDFTMWASNAASPQDVRLPEVAAVGTVVGDWVNLGNYRFPPPPSGLTPGFTNAADEDFVKKGVNFNFASGSQPVRYLRMMVHRTWSNGDFAHAMEVSVYGKVQ